MPGWMCGGDEWRGGCVHGWMKRWVDEWSYEWMEGLVGNWVDGKREEGREAKYRGVDSLINV